MGKDFSGTFCVVRAKFIEMEIFYVKPLNFKCALITRNILYLFHFLHNVESSAITFINFFFLSFMNAKEKVCMASAVLWLFFGAVSSMINERMCERKLRQTDEAEYSHLFTARLIIMLIIFNNIHNKTMTTSGEEACMRMKGGRSLLIFWTGISHCLAWKSAEVVDIVV